MLPAMRVASLVPLLALAGCTAGYALVAEPLATLDGSALLPAAVELVKEGRATRRALGLDPTPLGVRAVEVRVTNRDFAPLAIPPPEEWTILDASAGLPVARGLSAAEAARRVARTIRDGGGALTEEEERELADRFARRALAAGKLRPGGTAAGLIYFLPDAGVRLDRGGLASRFVAAPIGRVGGGEPSRPAAGRLRPR